MIMARRLRIQKLNQLFVASLETSLISNSDISAIPLIVDLNVGYTLKLRVYLRNCTNPPGGRSVDEYKIQVILPNYAPRDRITFDYSDSRWPIIGGYAVLDDNIDDGVFVFWDTAKHESLAYSSNLQVKAEVLFEAYNNHYSIGTRNNGEKVIACRPKHLLEALEKRIEITMDNIGV